MRIGFIILLLMSCTASRKSISVKVVTLDCTPSYVTGHGFFTGYKWVQTEGNKSVIDSPYSPVAKATVTGSGIFAWRVKLTDNLNQSDTATLKISVK